MSRHFVACDLGEERGRVMLGTLQQDNLTISEIRCFENLPIKDGKDVLWDIDRLYQDTLIGLREIGSHDEQVDGISCSSCAGAYLLFDSDASYIPPTYHRASPRAESGKKEVLAKAPWGEEFIYTETGVHNTTDSVLFQLGAEKSRRLKRADHLMPLADGFNFLLSGVPSVESSSASAMQLYNPAAKTWSELLVSLLGLPPKLLPAIVPAGTKLKPLRAEIASATRLEDAQIVASCSDEFAAALAGLPIQDGEQWACLRLGSNAVMGTPLTEPVINRRSRELQFSNTIGYQNAILFHKQTAGLWILEECRRFWADTDRGLDDGMLAHIASSAPPLESLIDLDDARFATPGDLPLKIQAYCKETGQPVPRKPGPVTRCVLESLALYYRKTLDQMANLAGRPIARMYLLGDSKNSLLNHFIANALQIPVVIVLADATAIGNVIVQAQALGHIKSLDQARQIIRQSSKTETIFPHVALWSSAYDRLMKLTANRPKVAQP
jgi:rhamnulokinase